MKNVKSLTQKKHKEYIFSPEVINYFGSHPISKVIKLISSRRQKEKNQVNIISLFFAKGNDTNIFCFEM